MYFIVHASICFAVVYCDVFCARQLVYFGSDDGGMRALERDTGQSLWTTNTADEVRGQRSISHIHNPRATINRCTLHLPWVTVTCTSGVTTGSCGLWMHARGR